MPDLCFRLCRYTCFSNNILLRNVRFSLADLLYFIKKRCITGYEVEMDSLRQTNGRFCLFKRYYLESSYWLTAY